MKKSLEIIGKEIRRNKNAHYPRLDTMIMVEETIKKEGVITKTKLYRELPKKVMFPTLEIIIQYLESKGIIVRDKIGQIVYTYNPKTLEKYRKLKHLEIKI